MALRLTFVLVAWMAFFANIQATVSAPPNNLDPLSNKGQLELYLRDPILIRREIDCVLKRGPCDKLGNAIRAAIPEVITHNCVRCTKQQAANAKKLIQFLQRNYPGVLQTVRRLYN